MAYQGFKHSEESIRKMRESKLGKIASPEARRNMSLASKGKKKSEQHRINIRNGVKRGSEHYLWKGDNAGYASIHRWVQSRRGVANLCEWCESTSKVEWANISRKYKRDLDDYMQLCHSCHMKYDKIPEKVWKTRKARYGYTGTKPKLAI